MVEYYDNQNSLSDENPYESCELCDFYNVISLKVENVKNSDGTQISRNGFRITTPYEKFSIRDLLQNLFIVLHEHNICNNMKTYTYDGRT